MGKISVDQRFALLAKLGENIDWDSLTTEQVQVGIRETRTFAALEFENFIRNGFQMKTRNFFRETGEFTLKIPALPRPTLNELRAREIFHSIESIDDTSPIEAITFKLGTVFDVGEKSPINSREYRFRIATMSDATLGFQHATWLVGNQDKFPEFMALAGEIYIIDFLGLRVCTDSGDDRAFPILRAANGSKRWELYWHWIKYELHSCGMRIAVASK